MHKKYTLLGLSIVLAISLTILFFGVALAEPTEPTGAVDIYDQCANDDGSGGATGTCSWTGGALNKNNSTYTEGDANVHRLYLDGLSPGNHVLVIEWQTTKGGKHAFDYLATWSYSEDWITQADFCTDITGLSLIHI